MYHGAMTTRAITEMDEYPPNSSLPKNCTTYGTLGFACS